MSNIQQNNVQGMVVGRGCIPGGNAPAVQGWPTQTRGRPPGISARKRARGLLHDVVLNAELVADFADAGDDGLVGAGAFLDIGGDRELGQGRG